MQGIERDVLLQPYVQHPGLFHCFHLPNHDAGKPQHLNYVAMMPRSLVGLALCGSAVCLPLAGAQLRIRLSVGHGSTKSTAFYIRLAPGSPTSKISSFHAIEGREQTPVKEDLWPGQAGGGRVASAVFDLSYPDDIASSPRPMHVMWADLISHSDADTARRLSSDAEGQAREGAVMVSVGKESPSGFTFTAAQIKKEKAMWIPAYDLFICLAEDPISFDAYDRSRRAQQHDRILVRTAKEPEATYAEYLSKWSDMGDASYMHPHQVPPGHIICLSWDSAIPKFGVDRGSGVWNDYGNPDHFRFWFSFGDLAQGIIKTWKSQRLADGLPIVMTTFENDGVRYEVEQFAYPLNGPPKERNGNIPLVLLQKVRLTNLEDRERVIPVSMTHRRSIPIQTGSSIEAQAAPSSYLFLEKAKKRVLLAVQGADTAPEWHETLDYETEDKRVARSNRLDITIAETLKRGQSKEFVVKLPSPIVDPSEASLFAKLDYTGARTATERFWTAWLGRGVQVEVPEKAVNDLFRASLWHALRLPRRHGGAGASIDLPYSNFAYDQTGIPWPGVHSIYVDYMLYELRGYSSVALEELINEFRLNQDANGHVSGFANWLMYTPSMLYASGQYYLLSHDRAGFERLLPYALKALEWCQTECSRARARTDFSGLVEGPLNDGTGEGIWAINQAYLYAGLERFGTALSQLGDSHAMAALAAAQQLRQAVQEGFAQASRSSALVQLRDDTWQPMVPSDAQRPRRLMEIWYPTDVDTGPLHLVRLKAIPAESPLADFLLNDHEDNLFLKGWGMANEPVYRPQGLAYLYRDDPKAVIRTFYSQMACAFSHTVFEPVEHRWVHGQYFGPPSTDGSWFELFRDLLVRESDDNTLIIGQATPRKWLEDGKQIRVSQAPTYFGDVSFSIRSHTSQEEIAATLEVPQNGPRLLLLRLRHPEEKKIRSVLVNGQPWRNFDANMEWVRIANPNAGHYNVVVSY